MTKLLKTYYIKTFGCQMNESDSERIASFLEANKFKSSEKIADANLVIFNTCGVRQTAEDRVYGAIHNLRKIDKEVFIIVTGCLANRQDVQRRLKDKVNLFIGINDFFKIDEPEIKNLLEIGNWKLEIPARANYKRCSYLSVSPKYKSSLKASVPIMTGCNNFCSYCVVPYARGREYSRPIEDIITEIDALSKKDYKEITLLGQNVNSYEYRIKNQDLKSKRKAEIKKLFIKFKNYKIKNFHQMSFPLLLNYLAQSYPQIKFNFLSSHPKDFSDELMETIKDNKNISREIHLPIQSGSNKILKLMNRPYTREHYLKLILKARRIISGVSFTTDAIVGFPGETEEDFQQTADIFKKVGYNEAYINKYSPRPGTTAYKLKDDISWEEKKRREKELRILINK
jgi:tRNA-2-methylthio-N6-dimethylallyladenosine synthase